MPVIIPQDDLPGLQIGDIVKVAGECYTIIDETLEPPNATPESIHESCTTCLSQSKYVCVEKREMVDPDDVTCSGAYTVVGYECVAVQENDYPYPDEFFVDGEWRTPGECWLSPLGSQRRSFEVVGEYSDTADCCTISCTDGKCYSAWFVVYSDDTCSIEVGTAGLFTFCCGALDGNAIGACAATEVVGGDLADLYPGYYAKLMTEPVEVTPDDFLAADCPAECAPTEPSSESQPSSEIPDEFMCYYGYVYLTGASCANRSPLHDIFATCLRLDTDGNLWDGDELLGSRNWVEGAGNDNACRDYSYALPGAYVRWRPVDPDTTYTTAEECAANCFDPTIEYQCMTKYTWLGLEANDDCAARDFGTADEAVAVCVARFDAGDGMEYYASIPGHRVTNVDICEEVLGGREMYKASVNVYETEAECDAGCDAGDLNSEDGGPGGPGVPPPIGESLAGSAAGSEGAGSGASGAGSEASGAGPEASGAGSEVSGGGGSDAVSGVSGEGVGDGLGSLSSLSSELGWIPGINSCNSCDPAMPDTMYVTFSGLTGGLSAYNGKHTVPHDNGCNWINWDLDGDESYNAECWLSWVTDHWECFINEFVGPPYDSANFLSGISNSPCDPRGSSTTCTGTGCGGAATCTISYS